jgi:aspartate aminotransferase
MFVSSDSKEFFELSERVAELTRSGKKITRLHGGSTGLPVPDAALAALKKYATTAPSAYGPPAGLDSLRSLIAERERCTRDEVIVGSGSKLLLYGLMNLLKKRGAKLLLPAPYWPAYPLMAQEVGLEITVLKTTLEQNWELRDVPFEKDTALILCNPLNPTSSCYPDGHVAQLVEQAQSKGAFMIHDEAYRDLAFRKIPKLSGIRLRSFSKEFNLEGLRLGYMVAPADIVKELTRFIQLTTTSCPPMVQEAGIACLKAKEQILSTNREIWQRRLTVLIQELRMFGFEFMPPEAGIYIFARHPRITDSIDFAKKLLERGVGVAPGGAFGPYPNYIRISAAVEEHQLQAAIRTMGKVLEGQ